MTNLLRVYGPGELGKDGYPLAWHRCPNCDGEGVVFPELDKPIVCPSCNSRGSIKALVRSMAGHRCERCHHPYIVGESNAEWSPCDDRCDHAGRMRVVYDGEVVLDVENFTGPDGQPGKLVPLPGATVEANRRVLTVHHLTGDWGNTRAAKADCRWWNLAALCQRCHLRIQGKVVMERAFILEHSEWFKPHAAGWYATKYLGIDLGPDEAEARQDELLALERLA